MADNDDKDNKDNNNQNNQNDQNDSNGIPPYNDIPLPSQDDFYGEPSSRSSSEPPAYLNESESIAQQAMADPILAGGIQGTVGPDGQIIPVNVPRRPDTQPIDPEFSATNQPDGYGYEEGAIARPQLDPSDPNYQPANQSNNTEGFDQDPNAPTEEDQREARRYLDSYDSERQGDVVFDTDEFGQTTGASSEPIIIEGTMEERLLHQESEADKGARLNTVIDRVEFLETLRASVGMKNDNYVHQNMLNPDAYQEIVKLDDAILSMPADALFDADHRAVALKFLGGLAQELKDNPNGTLETSIVSENVMTHDDFESLETQGAASGFALMNGDKMDSVVASMFTMQQKTDGNYPFLIDAAGRQPISAVFDQKSLSPVSAKQASSPKAMSAYLEVMFAHDNFEVLSDKYKNGVTKDQLSTQLDKFSDMGMIGNIRSTNRNLDKNPAAEHLFLLDGITVSEPVAFDEIRDFVSSAKMGTGAFSTTSNNPQMLKDKIANADKVLNYQVANLSYLPKHLAIPEGVRQLANVANVSNSTFDATAIDKQNRAIKRHGLKSDDWSKVSDKGEMGALFEKDPDSYKKITDALAFSIKNYHQLGNFSDKQNEHGSTSGFPLQAELRNTLSTMESISSKEVLESGVPVLAKINPVPADANTDLVFTNKDAQAIYNKMDSNLQRSDLTDSDVAKNTATQKDLADRGFVKGSEFTLVDTPKLDGFGAAQGRKLLSSYLNNLDSHRDFTTDGLASSLGAGNSALPSSPSDGAFGDAVSSISQALVDTNNGDIHPKKIGMVLDDILSTPDFEASARPVELNAAAPPSAELPTTESTPDVAPVTDISAAPNAEPSADGDQRQPKEGESSGDDGKKGKEGEEDEYDQEGNKKKGGKQNGNSNSNDGGGGIVTGVGAIVTGLFKGASWLGKLAFPTMNGVAQNASDSAVIGNSGPDASSKAKHPRLPENVHRNMTKMHESAIKFEISSKALEVNKQHNMLSPKDVKTVEKDVKKHFDAYNESALMASESLSSMAPSLSNGVRGNVASQMETVQKRMGESVTEATSKGLFSLNPNQKKISDEADNAVTKAVSGLKNFFTNKLTSLLGFGK